jgi:predicted AlkP superfamily pyrophosphatase or phosphodiesterase
VLSPRTALVAALTCLVAAVPAAAGALEPPPRTDPPPAAPLAERVLAISVDGLNPQAIRRLGRAGAPTFHRLIAESAGTLNARSEYELNITLPNHTSMVTSRRIDRRHDGHGVTWNVDLPGTTVQQAAGQPVSSVFSVVHEADGDTALFSTKSKFTLFERSWPEAVDAVTIDENQARLVRLARADLVAHDREFTFLHVSLPDRAGHARGGMSPAYLDAVRATDRHLGTVLRTITRDPELSANLAVVLTADHGFQAGRRDHAAKVYANYRIPFFVWGSAIERGDLYKLNPDYRDPGTSRPGYAGRQPVRNGDLGNLALDLLGLDPIPGSLLDADFSLGVE